MFTLSPPRVHRKDPFLHHILHPFAITRPMFRVAFLLPSASHTLHGIFPVLLDHVAGLLGDHVCRRVRVTGDYGRHHAGVHDPKTIDPVHP